MLANPITYNIDNRMLFAQAEGVILFEDIVNHYQLLFTQPNFFVGIPAIYDFTNVTRMSGDISHFEQIAQEMGDNKIIDKPSYVAIIVSPDNKSINTIFNAYSQMMDYTLMNVKVFHESSAALQWLQDNSDNG